VSVTVDVTATPPPPTINSFAMYASTGTTSNSNASPVSIAQVGQVLSAVWSTSNATSCSAADGSGAAGWSGTLPISSTGTTVGPLMIPQTYVFVLTCSGPGGTTAPSSVAVTVTTAAVVPTIGLFAALPPTIQVGASTLLTWTSANATSCTAGGGAGTWGGSVATGSAGTTSGPINTAGVYTFTLTCTGSGGTGATNSVTVAVTTATPPAAVLTFTAVPSTLTVGASTVLSWTTSGASACTASGGTGTDGWSGSQPTSSVGKIVGPINVPAQYVYTLNCTGPGGASAPASVGVTVNSATPAASIGFFAASPSTVTVGQSTSLSWSTSNATSCTATGGTGSDGWTGTEGPSSTGTSVGPFSVPGPVTYTLTCTGAGGASSSVSTGVIVTAALAAQPTVSLKANGHSSLTIAPGASASLTWASSSASSCVASGGAGSDNWSGTQATSSLGVSVGPDVTPGVYTYTLTCNGAGGSGSSSVQITVMSSNSADCGIPNVPTTSLVSPAASALNIVNGLCVGCTVLNQSNLITSTTNSPATVAELIGLLGGNVTLEVTDNSADFPAGRQVGFIVADGTTLLSLSLLSNVTITTYLNGTVQQVATTGNNLIQLQALGVLSVNQDAGFAGFTATEPFNQVSIRVNQLANVATTLNVYRACVSLQ
jgi:PKD repeat protein